MLKGRIQSYIHGNIGSSELQLLSEGEIRRIQFVNYISLISIITMMSYVVVYMTINVSLFLPAIIFLSCSSLFAFIVIMINNSGNRFLAKILVSLLNPLFMGSVATWLFGKEPGFQTFLFAAIIIPLFFWTMKEAVYLIIFSGISLTLYIFIEFFPPIFEPLIILPDGLLQLFRSSNILITFIATAIAIITYFELTGRQEIRLEQQAEVLAKAQIHRDKVYSIIGHDLKSPLSRLLGVTRLYLKLNESEKNSQEFEHLKKIYNSSKTLNSMLDNLLSWSKMHSGQLKLDQKAINLHELIYEIEELLGELLEEKKLILKKEIDKNIKVRADKNMIATVLRNLISNAIKYSNANSEIKVNAINNANEVEISVVDSGVGISEENLKLLFMEDSHIITKGTNEEKGSGLGLKLCKDFIDANGGKLWAKSTEGSGSTFSFTLKSVS